MDYEYKAIGAPERGKKHRGAKTASDRIAAAMQEALKEHCVGGWEYLRTDMVPVEERAGFFSRPRESVRAVMIFRRPVARSAPRTGLVAVEDDLPPAPPERILRAEPTLKTVETAGAGRGGQDAD